MARSHVVRGRDERLSWFAVGGRHDKGTPDASMAVTLEAVTDSSGRPPAEAADDEIVGMMGRWQALEARAHARMLAVVRELIRRRVPAGQAPAACPGDLLRRWDIGVAHEVAAELRISWQAASPLVVLAWELEARLPGTGRLLDRGVLTPLKVKVVTDEFSVLDDQKMAEAEKMLLEGDLAADDMTPGRLRRLCQRIADTVDPEGARQRREEAVRERARVSFFRAHGGDAAMFAEGLPADEALRCQGNVQARAVDYRKAMVYPEGRMDFLRVLALVDLINGVSLDQRIARYHAEHAAAEDARNAEQRARDQETAESLARHRERLFGSDGHGTAGGSGPEFGWPDEENDHGETRSGDDPDKPVPPVPDAEPPDIDDCEFWPGFSPDGPDPGHPGSPGSGSGFDGPVGGGGFPDPGEEPDADGRPDEGGEPDGEGGGSCGGDPGDDPGGGSRPDGPGGPGGRGPGGNGPGGNGPGGRGTGGVPDPGLPALAHLTLPLATLLNLGERPGEAPGFGSVDPGLVRDLGRAASASPRTRFCVTITDSHGHAAAHACARLIRSSAVSPSTGADPPGKGGRSARATPETGGRDGPAEDGWDLQPDAARPGPDGGYGAWILSVPGGSRYRLDLHPVPTHACDHRYATDSYRPGALLRHLVEIRDGECSFTGCSHPADRCDFEHATPYDKGGATDACNAGARSRRCHQVKQSPGWDVTQDGEPGWHTWSTPSGRSYTKGPRHYPD